MAGSDYDCLGIFERSNEMILQTKEDFENAILSGEEIKHSTVFYTGEIESNEQQPNLGYCRDDGFVFLGNFKGKELWVYKFDASIQMTYDEAVKYVKKNNCSLPDIDQLTCLYLFKEEMNKAFEACGGEPLKEDDYYWSSSEYSSSGSWKLNMNVGYRGNFDKSNYAYVRSFQLIEN
ncbi:MAG: hypothetical protein KHX55_02315 [Proteobacteria bacterium]|nr:hypothetical protein [Pseudomonadota bacterium]